MLLHDRDAVLAERNKVLEKRWKNFDYKHKPTVRQQMTRYHSMLDCVAGNNEAFRADMEKSEEIDMGISTDRAYCANI